jgi:YafQ family addiction module toxin component
MMALYQPAVSKKLKVQIEKIHKKDRVFYDSLMRKIKEILNDPHHYKPLRHDLKGFYRVHLEKSFVLIFTIEENNGVVKFIDLKHHDQIYRRK